MTGWTDLLVIVLAVLVVHLIRVLSRLEHLLAKPFTDRDAPTLVPHADAALDGPAFMPLWTDDVLADRELRERPDTVGANPWYVDTFDLEEGERQFALEQAIRAESDGHPRPAPH